MFSKLINLTQNKFNKYLALGFSIALISSMVFTAFTNTGLNLNNLVNETSKIANAAGPNTADLIIGRTETATTVDISVCVKATPGPLHLTDVSTFLGYTASALTPNATIVQKGRYDNSNGYGPLKWEAVGGTGTKWTLRLDYTGNGTAGNNGLLMESSAPELLGKVRFNKVSGGTGSTAVTLDKNTYFTTESDTIPLVQTVINGNGDCTSSQCPNNTTSVNGYNIPNACTSTCPAGQYNNTANATCVQCTAGSYCPANIFTPTPCVAGTYCPAGSPSPQNCPANTTSVTQAVQASQCTSTCAAGTSLNTTNYTCVACTSGQYCPANNSGPVSCPAGSYCPNTSSAPITCPANTTSPAGSTASSACISTCTAGNYLNGAVCSPCPAGSYCPGLTNAAPTACPANTNSAIGASTSAQCISTISPILNVKAFLHGPFNDTNDNLNNSLLTRGFLPNAQPYNIAPWSYTGTETLPASNVRTDICDWVLVEIRSTSGALITRKAAILKTDGSIIDAVNATTGNTTTGVSLSGVTITGSYKIIIRHRNHLSIATASNQTLTMGASSSIDFTTAVSTALSNNMIQVGTIGAGNTGAAIFGLRRGDSNSDGVSADAIDRSNIRNAGEVDGLYNPKDLNLDATLDAFDRSIARNTIEATEAL